MGNSIDKHIFANNDYIDQSIIPLVKFTDNRTSYILITPEIDNYSDKIIVFSHGNGDNIFTIYYLLLELSNIWNIKIIIYDYPGYGLTKGIPSEKECVRSLSDIICTYPGREIILLAHSLGTGVTLKMLSSCNFHPYLTILLAPFRNIPRVVSNSSSLDSSYSMINSNKFDSYWNIRLARGNIVIFHGKNDQVIHYSHSEDLYNHSFSKFRVNNNYRISIKYLEDEDHNNILTYLLSIKLDEILSL